VIGAAGGATGWERLCPHRCPQHYAHLSSLGLVYIPGSIVEPGFAASIVITAIDNIFGRGTKQMDRVGLMFLCGLLHGVCFASSIADMGLDTTHRILGLLERRHRNRPIHLS
jgi:hypothetical protein